MLFLSLIASALCISLHLCRLLPTLAWIAGCLRSVLLAISLSPPLSLSLSLYLYPALKNIIYIQVRRNIPAHYIIIM